MKTNNPPPVYVEIRPVKPEEIPGLEEAAKADSHILVLPTHIVQKGNEAVGYLSLGVVPTVMLWYHTQKMKTRDTWLATQVYENLMRAKGHAATMVLVQESSPLFPLMSHAGYEDGGVVHMFVKQLN